MFVPFRNCKFLIGQSKAIWSYAYAMGTDLLWMKSPQQGFWPHDFGHGPRVVNSILCRMRADYRVWAMVIFPANLMPQC